MGLSQYFYKVKQGQREEIGYRRKHYDLHEWLCQRLNDKGLGGSHIDPCCFTMELTERDLTDLRKWVSNKNYRIGWQFGWASSDDYKKSDLALIKQAKEAIKDGYVILYEPC